MGSLLDETTTWAEFGKQHLDRRLAKALTDTLQLKHPTLVQSRGIPVALEGKDLLCRARTGSGKTLCYAVPLVQRLLQLEAQGLAPLSGLILVPTKELIAQVHGVVTTLLTFCFDVLSVDVLLSGAKYTKAELPTMLVTTPSSLLALAKQRQAKATMRPLADTLKIMILDEADLMFSFGYEEDVKSLCALMPPKYQAMLVSATLSDEVQQLKGLMLHKPVVLKLEEPRVTGKLSQFHYVCHKTDKYLIIYTLLKLQLIQGKTPGPSLCHRRSRDVITRLIFVKSIEAAYRLRILLERFSINSAVLNSELPHSSRQNIIDTFNEGLVELLIATDEGLGADKDANAADADEVDWEEEDEEDEEEGEEGEEEEPEMDAEVKEAKAKSDPSQRRSALRKGSGQKDADAEADAEMEEAEEEEAEADEVQEELPKPARWRKSKDDQYSITRGVDLHGVSTVLNADVPTTVRDYVHRVGRCARGGASGTALTICTHEEEPMLQKIIRAQAAGGTGPLQPLPMQLSDAERFRYRVEDMAKGLTKKNVAKFRARELQLEALHSEKLKSYFEDHPEEKRALQRMQRQLRENKSIRAHLKSVPSYLVPETFTASTPVQKAVRDANRASGQISSASKRQRLIKARQQDPLHSFDEAGSAKRRDRFTRENMLARERKIDPSTANVEALPALSRHKLWKLKHGKRVRKPTDVFGERRRLPFGQRLRQKKFGRR
ncbi:unnamed protein product [Effrenium voratum]|nr:unnamed protein product [Effrenium voratum]